MNKIEINSNLIIIIFVLISYATIGFFDDFLKIKRKNNKGLTEIQKLIGQIIIAAVFFYIFIKSGSKPLFAVTMFNIKLNLGWFYAVFILFMLVGSANAVNITDGLDGLATGLSIIATVCIGIITWATYWLTGYQDIALFCFIFTGSLIGFMVFNSY
ncbi:MAG TPA: phospho-N-acetylmuramoyl-pentapeptide-transferase, partial [Bacilli bacterium]|nr:phospho-N-acetylmuramoyl-pentapeptide-transferase [Bacilli bacterium]